MINLAPKEYTSKVLAHQDTVVIESEKESEKPDEYEELEAVKQASLFAFYDTSDYAEIVNNNLAPVATSRVKDYKKFWKESQNL